MDVGYFWPFNGCLGVFFGGDSLEAFQRIADSARGVDSLIRITNISQSSPVNVDISGAAKAIELAEELLTPWKREHKQKMADLQERKLKLEMIKLHTEATSNRQRDNLTRAEIRKANAEAERIEIENAEKRIKLEQAEIENKMRMAVMQAVNTLVGDAEIDAATRLQFHTLALNAFSAFIHSRFDIKLIDDSDQP